MPQGINVFYDYHKLACLWIWIVYEAMFTDFYL